MIAYAIIDIALHLSVLSSCKALACFFLLIENLIPQKLDSAHVTNWAPALSICPDTTRLDTPEFTYTVTHTLTLDRTV